jgi:hypothetical protein
MLRLNRALTTLSLVVLSALSICFVFAAHAPAKDSLAPKSAGDRWLPCERWVLYHWNPIDSTKFYELTGSTQRELYVWTRDDDSHDLADFIKTKKLDPKKIVRESLAIDDSTSPRVKTILNKRANRLLTQGHLAQHVFFHWFHNPAIRQNAKEIFGMNPWDYARARRLGYSPADIGKLKRGYTREQTADRIIKVLTRYEMRGEKGGATSKTQADRYVRDIKRLADHWIDQRYHKRRPKGGLPPATHRSRKNGSTSTCRDFVGAGQARDGFTHASSATTGGSDVDMVLDCPLDVAPQASAAGDRSSRVRS